MTSERLDLSISGSAMLGFWMTVIACLVLGSLGCSGDGGAGGTGGSSPSNVAIRGTVFDFAEREPLDGVEACYEDTCSTTDLEGRFAAEVPAESEVALTFEKPGYGPTLFPFITESQSIELTALLFDDATREAGAALLDTPYPPDGTGYVEIEVFRGVIGENDRLSGVSFALRSGEGKRYYLDESGEPSTELTETSSQGTGGFVELAPGVVSIEVSGAAGCEGNLSWEETDPNVFTVPIRAGFFTPLVVSCE